MTPLKLHSVILALALAGVGCATGPHSAPEDSITLHIHGNKGQFLEIVLFSDLTVSSGINGKFDGRAATAFKEHSKQAWAEAVQLHRTVPEDVYYFPDHEPCIITITMSGVAKRYVLTHMEQHKKLPGNLKTVLMTMTAQIDW